MILPGGALLKANLTLTYPGRRLRTLSTVTRVTQNSSGYSQIIYNGPGIFVPDCLAYSGFTANGLFTSVNNSVFFELKDMATTRLIMSDCFSSSGQTPNFCNAFANMESGLIIEPNRGLILSWTSGALAQLFDFTMDIMGTEYL